MGRVGDVVVVVVTRVSCEWYNYPGPHTGPGRISFTSGVRHLWADHNYERITVEMEFLYTFLNIYEQYTGFPRLIYLFTYPQQCTAVWNEWMLKYIPVRAVSQAQNFVCDLKLVHWWTVSNTERAQLFFAICTSSLIFPLMHLASFMETPDVTAVCIIGYMRCVPVMGNVQCTQHITRGSAVSAVPARTHKKSTLEHKTPGTQTN